QSLAELLRRPEIAYPHIAEIGSHHADDPNVAEQVEIEIKYEGYISRQTDEIERLRRNENTRLPVDLDYDVIGGLSNEIKQKLQAVRPETVAQASRIQGVTPAAVSQILVHLKKRDLLRKQSAWYDVSTVSERAPRRAGCLDAVPQRKPATAAAGCSGSTHQTERSLQPGRRAQRAGNGVAPVAGQPEHPAVDHHSASAGCRCRWGAAGHSPGHRVSGQTFHPARQ